MSDQRCSPYPSESACASGAGADGCSRRRYWLRRAHHQEPNPSSPHTYLGDSEALYGLRDLAKALGDIGALPESHRGAQTVLDSLVGRNVALFNLTRQWAYRARLRYTEYSEWSETVYAFASLKNASVIADEFSRGPMGEGEVLQVANSIARWVWRNITPEQTVTNRKRWGSSLGKNPQRSGKRRVMSGYKRSWRSSKWELRCNVNAQNCS